MLLILLSILFSQVCSKTTSHTSLIKGGTVRRSLRDGVNSTDNNSLADAGTEGITTDTIDKSIEQDDLSAQPGSLSGEDVKNNTDSVIQTHSEADSVLMKGRPENMSARPPEWPEDDDDDFIAKKEAGNGEESTVKNSKSNLSDEGSSTFRDGGENEEETIVNSEISSKDSQVQKESVSDYAPSLGKETESVALGDVSGEQENYVSSTVKGDLGADEIGSDGNTDKPYIEQVVGDTDIIKSTNGIEEAAAEAATVTSAQYGSSATEPANFEPNTGVTVSSETAYHRNESNEEDNLTENEIEAKEVQPSLPESETSEIKNEEQNDPSALSPDSSNEEVVDISSQFCRPATNCIDCVNLSIDHIRSNSDPCYWVGQCISAGEASKMNDAPSGAYKCADDGSPLYTGEDWNAALNAIDGSSQQVPIDENRGEIPTNYYYDEYEDDGCFENVKFTFNVILLAAVIAMVLFIRKRVLNRLRDDPSLDQAEVVREEVISSVKSIASYAQSIMSRSGGNSESEYRPVATNNGNDSFERQVIPLSTADDEEWGWDDEDTGPSAELPAISADDGAEEDEELALAIAMSLSENSKNETTGSLIQSNSINQHQKPSITKPKTSSPFLNKVKKSPIAVPKPKATISQFQQTSPSSAKEDTIEDLLGQMNASGGQVITSFGQKPQTAKSKPVAQKKDSEDDIFSSMGLAAPRSSAPAPASKALSAVSVDEDNNDDADWGDEDLDDLLGD